MSSGNPAREIPLKLKYRARKPVGRNKADYNGNQGKSAGKHTGHPDIPGYRAKGYRCDPKLNPKPAAVPAVAGDRPQ